jgi:hypothetical protein
VGVSDASILATLAIITDILLQEHNANEVPITFISDNKCMQQGCNNIKINRVGHHRKANMDLQMEHVTRAKTLNARHEWVK